MQLKGRLYLISVLLIASIIMITSSTMAFYSQSTTITANISTAGFELRVNESTAETQTLSDMTIAPGETLSRDIKIDTSGLDTSSALAVTLSIHASGNLPVGLSVSLDGVEATGTDDLSAVISVDDAEKQVIYMTVSATWATTEGEDLEQYRDLAISYEVAVVADQMAGS